MTCLVWTLGLIEAKPQFGFLVEQVGPYAWKIIL